MNKENIITRIEKQQKRNRYNIYIDDEYKFSVDEDILVKYRLLKEREILPQEIEIVIEKDQFNKMYQRVLKYISFKSRTEKEVSNYLLAKEYSENQVQQVLQLLKDTNFINDSLYADNYVKERISLNPKGRKLLAYELKLKGIKQETIEKSLEQLDDQLELDLAYQLLVKRSKSIRIDDWNKLHNRLGSYLQRRGFSYSVCRQALDLLKANILDNNSK